MKIKANRTLNTINYFHLYFAVNARVEEVGEKQTIVTAAVLKPFRQIFSFDL